MSVISGQNTLIQVSPVIIGTPPAGDTISTTAFATISDCAAWELTETGEVSSYVSCSTGGSKKKTPGAKDTTGTLKYFRNLEDDVYEHFRVNGKVGLKLYEDQTANPANVGGGHSDSFFVISALIKSIKTGADSGSADPLEVNIEWEGNGVLYYPGDTVPDTISA